MNDYLRTKDAAEYLGVAIDTLRGYARDGLIPYSRPGGRLLIFSKADLDKWIEKHRSEA